MGTVVSNIVILGIRYQKEEIVKEMRFKDYDEFHEYIDSRKLWYSPYNSKPGDFVVTQHQDGKFYYFGIIIDMSYPGEHSFTEQNLTNTWDGTAIEHKEEPKVRALNMFWNLKLPPGKVPAMFSICPHN